MGLSEAVIAEFQDQHIQPREGLAGFIAKTGEFIYIPVDCSRDPRITRPVIEEEGLNSFFGTPIDAFKIILDSTYMITGKRKFYKEGKERLGYWG